MLIDDYELRLLSPPCQPGSDHWSAFAALKRDISEVLPYLNAVWRGADYDHAGKVLICRFAACVVAVRPHEIGLSDVKDRAEAESVLRDLIKEINAAWERRCGIKPDVKRRPRATAMDIYRVLPRTNCKACGQQTCFTFALQLVAGNAKLAQCDPLKTTSFSRNRQALAELLGAAWN